jgi:hypothetical protein
MTADKPQAGHGQLLLAAENRVTPGLYNLIENPPKSPFFKWGLSQEIQNVPPFDQGWQGDFSRASGQRVTY